jgi:hypothetical protein
VNADRNQWSLGPGRRFRKLGMLFEPEPTKFNRWGKNPRPWSPPQPSARTVGHRFLRVPIFALVAFSRFLRTGLGGPLPRRPRRILSCNFPCLGALWGWSWLRVKVLADSFGWDLESSWSWSGLPSSFRPVLSIWRELPSTAHACPAPSASRPPSSALPLHWAGRRP